MHSIRIVALLGLIVALGAPVQADEEDHSLMIKYVLTGVGADDADPYADWLETEDDAIESVTLEDGTVTVMLKAGDEVTLEDLFDMTNTYAEDKQKDGITFDVGSVALDGKVLADFANVDSETEHNDLIRKIDDMENVKAWGEKDAPNGQFWIQTEGEEAVELRTILDEIGVESKLLTEYDDLGREVDEVALENLTWRLDRVD